VQQREKGQLKPLFLSLKTPTKTSQNKAETGNAWQTTWGQCRVAALVTRGGNMMQGDSSHQQLQPLVCGLEKAHTGFLQES